MEASLSSNLDLKLRNFAKAKVPERKLLHYDHFGIYIITFKGKKFARSKIKTTLVNDQKIFSMTILYTVPLLLVDGRTEAD